MRGTAFARGALLVVCAGPWHAVVSCATAAAPAPYSTLTIGMSAGRSIHDGELDRYWSSATPLRLDVHTAFYAGEAGAFVLTLPYAARSREQPDYRAYAIGLDWRFAPAAHLPVHPVVSVSAGNYLMTFEGVTTKGLAKESEIFVGGSAGLAARVRRGTSITALATGLRVFTSTPIRTGFATVGISHRFTTPGWMRRVFE